jgi:hypothetical protein
MNAIMQRWIQTCRHELLDRTLVWNQAHLLHALREYERHYNGHWLARSGTAARITVMIEAVIRSRPPVHDAASNLRDGPPRHPGERSSTRPTLEV